MKRALPFQFPLSQRLLRYTVYKDDRPFVITDTTTFEACLNVASLNTNDAHHHKINNANIWLKDARLPALSIIVDSFRSTVDANFTITQNY